MLLCAFTLIFNLFALPWIRKPLLIILVLISAAANYFMFSFGTVIDTNMVQNIFETDIQEATALLSGRFWWWMALMGLIPALLLALMNIEQPHPWWFGLAMRALCSIASMLIVLMVAAMFYKDYASMLRNNKGLIKMVTPANFISGTGHYAYNHWFAGNQTLIRIGEDAKKGPLIRTSKKKRWW